MGPLHNEVVLEMGMGRGRLALQLFLLGATVLGVELAQGRYRQAVAALEKLVKRHPQRYVIVGRSATSIRAERIGLDADGVHFCELRSGNFLADSTVAAKEHH